jgi:hypothetical protein
VQVRTNGNVGALLGREPLGERPGEAGDHAVVAGQPGVGLLAAVATGERGHSQDVRVGHQVGVEVVELGEGQLEHDVLVGSELIEVLVQGCFEQRLGLGLLRAVDVDLGF